jgi:hypothetical protein
VQIPPVFRAVSFGVVLGCVVCTSILSVRRRDMQLGSVRERTVLRVSWLDREPALGSVHGPSKKVRASFIPVYLIVPLFTFGFFACFSIYALAGTYSVELHTARDTIQRLSLRLRRLPSTPTPMRPPANVLSAWDVGGDNVLLRTFIDGEYPVVDALRVSVVIIAPMYDGATHDATMLQVLTLVAHSSPHTNLRIYVGLHKPAHAHMCYMMIHNTTAPFNTHVELVVLGLKPRTTLSRRTHLLAARALVDIRDADGFILVVHNSCTLNSQLDVRNLTPTGLGFMLVRSPILPRTLHKEIDSHDLGLASDPLFVHTSRASREQAYRPGTVRSAHGPVLHCSGSLMHPMHHTH